jgi:hypothetical protein
MPSCDANVRRTGDIGLMEIWTATVVRSVLYRNGTWFIDSNLTATVTAQVGFGGAGGDIPLLGDMNGDGRDDLIIYRSGTWYVNFSWRANVDAVYHFGGVVHFVGDERDGKLDLIIYRNGVWYVSNNPNAVSVDAVYQFGGVPGDVPWSSLRW